MIKVHTIGTGLSALTPPKGLAGHWQSFCLHHAARTNNVQLAARLLAEGVPPDIQGHGLVAMKMPNGHSPLLVAALKGHMDVARILIGAGANPWHVGFLPWSILDHMVKKVGKQAVRLGQPIQEAWSFAEKDVRMALFIHQSGGGRGNFSSQLDQRYEFSEHVLDRWRIVLNARDEKARFEANLAAGTSTPCVARFSRQSRL